MRSRTISILALISLGFNAASLAIVTDDANPYSSIPVRNVFGLKPPPPPQPVTPEVAPPPKITLTGIYNLGHKRALMLVPVAAKPPAPAKEESYILGEGERDGDIEVMAIDLKAGTVQVNNHGKVQTLDFEKNGAKLPTPAAMPGVVPGQVPIQAMNTAVPISAPSPGAGGVVRFGNSQAPPSLSAGGPQSGFADGSSAPASTKFQNMMTPEEQALIIEAQRVKMMDSGDETFKILPPTPLTSQVVGDGTSDGSALDNSGPPRPF